MSHFRSQNSKQNHQATNQKHYQAGDTRDVYLYHINHWNTHKKFSIAKLDFIQVCRLSLSLNFYINTLRKI